MSQFEVGSRVVVNVPERFPFHATVQRVVMRDGVMGGVFGIVPDHRPHNPDTDFHFGIHLDLLSPINDSLPIRHRDGLVVFG